MLPTLYDVELWLEYAKQMQALGDRAADHQLKQRFSAAAQGFERIAYLANQLRSNAPRRRSWYRAA